MGLRRNVMFCGDSITEGFGGATNYGGFRAKLLGLRKTNNLPWRCGGSTTNMISGENRYCGGSGLTIAQIDALLAIDGPQWVYDTIIAHVGTNDATQRNTGGVPTLATSQANLTTFLDRIRAQQPTARVFFALIIPNTNAGADTLITAQNAAFAAQIAARADAGFITVVDQNAAFRANAAWATEWMADATHPNNFGYVTMANTWDTALTAAGW
jgi:lysophospholipase L1-like esterase